MQIFLLVFYVLVHFLILQYQYFYTVKFAMLSNILYCQNVLVRTVDHSSEPFSSTVYYAVLLSDDALYNS